MSARWEYRVIDADKIHGGNSLRALIGRWINQPQETVRYTKTQPLNKRNLGFGTKDAFKRGEFTAAIRTEQYR